MQGTGTTSREKTLDFKMSIEYIYEKNMQNHFILLFQLSIRTVGSKKWRVKMMVPRFLKHWSFQNEPPQKTARESSGILFGNRVRFLGTDLLLLAFTFTIAIYPFFLIFF